MNDSAQPVDLEAAGRRSLTGEVLAEREHWLIRLRWMAVAGMFGITSIARWVFGVELAAGSIFALAALVAGYNTLLLIWLRRRERKGVEAVGRDLRRMTNLQISMDLLVLTFVLHFSGGVTNPVSAFMVFHMAIASILLPRGDSYLQAAWASALYVMLAVVEMTFPRFHRAMSGYMFDIGTPAERIFSRPVFVVGECGALVITLFLIVYFTSDIADRLRRAYRRLAEANAELAKLEQTKSRFLHIAGHQIRTPLAAMYSLLEGLPFAGAPLSEGQTAIVRRVQRRASGMLDLVNEMLTLSAVKEDLRRQTPRRAVSLRKVLEGLVELHAESARAKGITLSFPDDEDASVEAWSRALEDVFGNLLSNAVKYTPSGGRVAVTMQRRGRRVAVTVSDTGIGVPPEVQENLFSEFFRANNARDVAEGTGLGLSIVKETVERLGGRVTLCSDVDSGTTVWVELPIAP